MVKTELSKLSRYIRANDYKKNPYSHQGDMSSSFLDNLAEREGFEPSLELAPH